MTYATDRKKNKIAIFGTFFSWIGIYKSPCEELADKLEKNNWQVIRVSNKINKVNRLLDLVITALKRRNDYNVGTLEVYSGPAFIWAEAVGLVLSILGKPYILTLHGGNLPRFAKKYPRRVKRLLKNAEKVTVPSNYFFERMISYREDLILIPNPIAIDRYEFKQKEKVKPKLVWLRKFRYIYNSVLVPKVVKNLEKSGIEAYVSMIGPDSRDGSLKKTKKVARKLDVYNRISFVGGVPKEKIADYLKQHDIFINTTNIDNTPVTVIEAMACGLCIVSTNVGGIPYLLEHEKDALLVPPNDCNAMTNAIVRLLNEPELAIGLSCNARKKAEQFDWEKVLPKWETILAGIT